MSLADRYQKPDTRTKFEKWLDTLSDNNRNIVNGWLTDTDNISAQTLAVMIRDDDPEDGFVGYRCNKDTISAWRRVNVAG